jgi:hypothetical protein
MALQTIRFKLAKLSVGNNTAPNAQQIATDANRFILLRDFVIVLPLFAAVRAFATA